MYLCISSLKKSHQNHTIVNSLKRFDIQKYSFLLLERPFQPAKHTQIVMQENPFSERQSSVVFQTNLSQFDYSLNDSNIEDVLTTELQENDSDDDEDINKYHQLLLDNFTEDAKSQADSQYDNLDEDEELNEKHSAKSVKSRHSTGSVKTFNSTDSVKTGMTPKTLQEDNQSQLPKNKKKYLRQEARRIKNQLKKEEAKMKKELRQFRRIDMVMEGKKGSRTRDSAYKRKRRTLTKRTFELLAKKFDDYYSSERNPTFQGPRLGLKDIGLLFDIGYSTITRLYSEWMQDPSFYERLRKEESRQKVPERKLTLQRLEHVARLIKENPFMTQNELTVQLNKIDQLKVKKCGALIEITRTTVARLLKVGKFKKKRVKCVPKERNTAKSLEKRFDYCSKYKDIWMKQARIYFLDESGFNLYMTRDKAWARPNQEITVNCPISKGKRFSVIAIIAEDGLTHWRIIEGTYRKYEYLDFIRQLFIRLREEMDDMTQQQRNSEEGKREKWLILDNCAIHDKEQTQNLGKECEMNILYLPPYSPQLNPIENWFSEVKSKIRKINYTGEKQLLDIMNRTLKEYENHDFNNYFRGILKHVEKGINKEKF